MPHPSSSCHTLLPHVAPLFLMPHPSSSCHTLLPHAAPLFLMPHPSSSCHTLLPHAAPLFLMPHPSSSCHTPLPHVAPLFLMPHPQVIFPLEQNVQLLSMAVQAATRHGSGWSHSITEEDLIAAATDSDVIELMASRLLRRLGGEEGRTKEGEASS